WYATAAAIYLVITLLTQQLIKVVEKKYQIQDTQSYDIKSKKKISKKPIAQGVS
ncbi:TPA: arginine ABC transporter permease ArtQ, partial [Photobacterium damselae]